MPICPNCGYSKKEIVNNNTFQGKFINIPNKSGMLPLWCCCISPVNLITGNITFYLRSLFYMEHIRDEHGMEL